MTIRFNSLVKQFSDDRVVVQVDQLQVPSGRFVSIVGPSGCGKTTLLRLVAGLETPTQGEIEFPAGDASTAFVFQEPNLMPWRTAFENVRLPLELRNEISRASIEQIPKTLRSVGLSEDDEQKFPRMLSGGMRMRVSLARALVVKPSIVLFDEPFAALDDLLRNQLNQMLLQIWSEQKWTAMFVTHNISEAVFLSQEVWVMHAQPGRLVARMDVPFDYPRQNELRTTAAFAEFCGSVMHALAGTA